MDTKDKWDEMYDAVAAIIQFESGELDDQAILTLFSYLVRTGQAWTLQGSYGRMAASLIEAGILDTSGNILKEVGE